MDDILDLFQSNRPIEDLRQETDYLDTIQKGQMISDFLINITNADEDKVQPVSLISVYGKWGSGKTSLMYWIKNNLPKDMFCCRFFEAWKYEKDSNLSLSLLDVIYEEDNDNSLIKRT